MLPASGRRPQPSPIRHRVSPRRAWRIGDGGGLSAHGGVLLLRTLLEEFGAHAVTSTAIDCMGVKKTVAGPRGPG
jgi:hypothetical protein